MHAIKRAVELFKWMLEAVIRLQSLHAIKRSEVLLQAALLEVALDVVAVLVVMALPSKAAWTG